MSTLSQFTSSASSGSIIKDTPIESGETISIGDPVGINVDGNAVKLVASDVTLLLTSIAYNASYYILSYTADKYVIYIQASSTLAYIYLYDQSTNWLSAGYSFATTAAGSMLDVRQLSTGNLILLLVDGTSYYTMALTSLGAFINKSSTLVDNASVAQALIQLEVGSTSGEYFVIWFTSSYLLCINRYNSSHAVQSSIGSATTFSVSVSTVMKFRSVVGTTNMCIFSCTASDNTGITAITINMTTGAKVAEVEYTPPVYNKRIGFAEYDAGTGTFCCVTASGTTIQWLTMLVVSESTGAKTIGQMIGTGVTAGTYVGIATLPNKQGFFVYGTSPTYEIYQIIFQYTGGTFSPIRQKNIRPVVAGATNSNVYVYRRPGAFSAGYESPGATLNGWGVDAGNIIGFSRVTTSGDLNYLGCIPPTSYNFSLDSSFLSGPSQVGEFGKYLFYLELVSAGTTFQLMLIRIKNAAWYGTCTSSGGGLVSIDYSKFVTTPSVRTYKLRPVYSFAVNNIIYKTGK